MITKFNKEFTRGNIYANSWLQELCIEFDTGSASFENLLLEILDVIEKDAIFAEAIKKQKFVGLNTLEKRYAKEYEIHNIVNFKNQSFVGYLKEQIIRIWDAKLPINTPEEFQALYKRFVRLVLSKLDGYLIPECEVHYKQKDQAIMIEGRYFSFTLEKDKGVFFVNE